WADCLESRGPGSRPARAARRATRPTRVSRSRPERNTCTGAGDDRAWDIHPTAALSMALDWCDRSDLVDGIPTFDVEQLEGSDRRGLVGTAVAVRRCRGDHVGRPLSQGQSRTLGVAVRLIACLQP